MSMTLYSGYIFADLRLAAVWGRPGLGFYRVGFSCEFSFAGSKQPGARIQELFGTAWVRGASGAEKLLGQVFQESPVVLDSRTSAWNVQVMLCLDLDPYKIEAIENLRNGGDLNFRLMIGGIVQTPSGGQTQAVHENGLSLAVNQRTWIDVLKAAGYGRFLVIEIPYPAEDASGPLAQAVSNLEKAKSHFGMGHYDEAVAGCRKALDSLTAGLGDADKVKEARNSYFEERDIREDMPIEIRARFLREAIRHYAHPAAHGESTSNQEHYDRVDARLMLTITAAALAHELK